jgi:hypothetical protein
VLALVGDDEDATTSVLDRAVELADAEHARLTLAKTSGAGRVALCLCSFTVLTCAPAVTREQMQAEAAQRLAQVADSIPDWIPLSTVVLGCDTPRALERLVEHGAYDLLVVSERDVLQRGLRRAIRRLGIATLMLAAEPVAQPQPPVRRAFRPLPAPHT